MSQSESVELMGKGVEFSAGIISLLMPGIYMVGMSLFLFLIVMDQACSVHLRSSLREKHGKVKKDDGVRISGHPLTPTARKEREGKDDLSQKQDRRHNQPPA